jgi:tRNA A-37 threonylcarbamoyl transferase component Bud32
VTSVLGSSLGNYRVVQQLSEGGMGVVYIGHHEALGRRVVIKVLRPDLSNDADMVQRFFNEARAATAIRSPGIVQVFDFGFTPDRRAYFVMELLDGESLAARLKRRRYDFTECCRLGRQVANVLQAAHAAGIVHRDLKPANLFLVPDPEVVSGERVKVLDFGIAKLAGDAGSAGVQTGTGLMMGTPYYMSPEQCRSASAADARSDIYSLGCILFQIACGRPPFVFAGVGDIVAAHLHEPPPHPHQLAPGVPPSLSALIAQMLAKHPDARPQTMAAVGQALDDIVRAMDPAGAAAPAPQPMAPTAAQPGALAAAQPALLAIAQPAPPAVIQPIQFALAEPVRLPRPPIPGFSSIATTLRRLTGSFSARRERVRRLTYVLGALVIVGAVTAIAIVLARDHAGPVERTVSYAKIAAASRANQAAAPAADTAVPDTPVAGAAVTDATTANGAAGSGEAPPAADAMVAAIEVADAPAGSHAPNTATIADAAVNASSSTGLIEAECRRHQVDRNWPALAQCADKLRPLAPKLAAEFATRAAEEARSAPHVAAAQAALRDRALKRAKAEIDQVWPGSVDCADLKRAYDTAEAQEIDALAMQLKSVKDASCEAYDQLLAKHRVSGPPRIALEAARRVECKAPPRCNADALEAKARALFNQDKYPEALKSYDAAYACKPAQKLLQSALIVACNMRDKVVARSYWKQLSSDLRSQSLATCVNNGITAAALNSR